MIDLAPDQILVLGVLGFGLLLGLFMPENDETAEDDDDDLDGGPLFS